jgi:hypothetical protein
MPSPFAHQTTSAQCDTCHTSAASLNYTTWAGAGYSHSTADAGKCNNSGCHAAGGAGKGIAAKTGHNLLPGITSMSCDSGGCHKVPGTLSFAGGNLVHSLFTATRCDACHNGSLTTFGAAGAVVKVSNHIPTTITGALDCNTCHKGTPPATAAAAAGGATVWATGEKMNHNGAVGGGAPIYCVDCHLKGVTWLSKAQLLSHNGASKAKDCSSTSCHKPLGSKGTSWVKWN